jgi:fluoride exporter
MLKWVLLCVAGAAGTLARYTIGGCACQMMGIRFPYGTLAVNLLGCLIIGFVASLDGVKAWLTPDIRLWVMVGFLGAFTTFSSFIFETANLMKDGQLVLAFGNVFLSVFLGLIFFYVGVLLGKLV